MEAWNLCLPSSLLGLSWLQCKAFGHASRGCFYMMKRRLTGAIYLLLGLVFVLSLKATEVVVTNGTQFLDADGHVVHAHGGGMIKVDGHFYWYGEHRDPSDHFLGISCYESTDLKTWNYRGDVLSRDSAKELATCAVERPKVLFNKLTQKYVLWMHWENGRDYSQARCAVALGDSPDHPFIYQGSFRPCQDQEVIDHGIPGYMSRDCTLFEDTDGKGYFISAANDNADLHIYELTPDFQHIAKLTARLFAGQFREAPCLFKKNNAYYLITSGCTGWIPNQAKYACSTNIAGDWSALRELQDSLTTYDSQPACVVPLAGSTGTSYLYAGDRWAGAWHKPVSDSKYVWLPLAFDTNCDLKLTYAGKVRIDISKGTIINQDLPGHSLVPKVINQAPDYFCTWNIQGYICSYKSPEDQRAQMTEANLFGGGKYQDWAGLYPRIRGDLILVMDDSWDVPANGDSSYFGSLQLNEQRFPSFTGAPDERLKALVTKVKAAGWKGLGGWVCAQQAPRFAVPNERAYWIERLNWMRQAGVAYWKVDWGKNERSAPWRRMLTELGSVYAPDLVIEHALVAEVADTAAVFRTYDVENVVAAPVTIDRVANLIGHGTSQFSAVVNCEDEPYIAVGLGCAIGIMRHPFAGTLPNGQPDMVFPVTGRDLKRRLDEMVRAVRWHKIARPLPGDATKNVVDSRRMEDTWMLEQSETWTDSRPGDWRRASAPARISRGLALPEVKVAKAERAPFVLATRYTNGAIAIAAIGRTTNRQYQNPKAEVALMVGDAPGPFGLFGYFASVMLKFDHPLGPIQVLAQDLMAEESTDITEEVSIQNNELTIPGELISRIGLSAASTNDLSEPGMVLVVAKAAN